MLLGIFKIAGHSMLPNLKPNDRVIVSSVPYILSSLRVSDVVVFKYNNQTMVKRIIKFEKSKILVAGDNSIDSLKIELLERSQILGKVFFVIP